jgi:putative transposase
LRNSGAPYSSSVRKAFKYRLYPNRSQSAALARMLETHRRLYNEALAERRDDFEREKRSVSYGEQSAALKDARKTNSFLAATNFSSTQATLRRLDRAFKAFFRRLKSGESPGYPRFKGRDRFDTVEFPSYGDGCRLKGKRLYLQHTGHVKVKLHRPVEGTIRTVSIKRKCGKWYAIFSCNLGDAPEATGDGPAIGIDLGLESFLVRSDGDVVEPPRYYRKAQKILSRRKKGSRGRCKARERVAKLHEKIASQRRDFHHKEARKLVESYKLISHEALNARGIARTHLAKSTHDAGWAQFLDILAQKAEEAVVRVVAVDPKNTTQACSRCGALPSEKKTLSVRTHFCKRCGFTADRDLNAARNILGLGRSLQGAEAVASVLN